MSADSNGKKTSSSWTTEHVAMMLDQAIENLPDIGDCGLFKKKVYNDIATAINRKFETAYDNSQIKLKYVQIKGQYAEWSQLISQSSGIAIWDNDEKILSIPDEQVFNEYVAAHPKAKIFRKKPFLHSVPCALLFGGRFCDGAYAKVGCPKGNNTSGRALPNLASSGEFSSLDKENDDLTTGMFRLFKLL